MKKIIYLLTLVLVSSCGINKNAYNETRMKINQQQKIIEKEDAKLYQNKKEIDKIYFHIIEGKVNNLSKYYVIAKKIINKTNANAIYHDIMDKGRYPNAILVQDNYNLLYYIIIDATQTKEKAKEILLNNVSFYPDIFIGE